MNKYAFGLWLSVEIIGTSICWNMISYQYTIPSNVMNLLVSGIWLLGTTVNTWFFYEWIDKELKDWKNDLTKEKEQEKPYPDK